MVHCLRTREGSIGSQHTAAKEVVVKPPTRDHEQSGHNSFVSHVGQTGALASEAGQGVRGVAWFQQQRRHSTVSMLGPASTQQQGKTQNRGTYRYSV